MISLLAALTMAVFTAQATGVNPQAAALTEFSKQLKAYLALRAEVVKKLEPMAPTVSATELHAHQQALADGIRKARAGAKPGDLVPLEVRRQIRRTVSADFRRREPAATKAALEEVPLGRPPGINRQYPEQAPLPPIPPLLLASLPPLPDNLQYRFFGRHIVILDGDLEMVVDYVENVIPR